MIMTDDDDDDDDLDWIQCHTLDPWNGIQATTQRPVNRNPPHDASLRLHAGQLVTMLAQPFWCWHNASMLSGTYVVAVSTYSHTTAPHFQPAIGNPAHPATPPTLPPTTNEEPRACLFGVVPVHAFLVADVL